MTDTERLYISDKVRNLLTEARRGEVSLLTEKLSHIAFLLETPGWLSSDQLDELRKEAA